jgi:hypothetical protein
MFAALSTIVRTDAAKAAVSNGAASGRGQYASCTGAPAASKVQLRRAPTSTGLSASTS